MVTLRRDDGPPGAEEVKGSTHHSAVQTCQRRHFECKLVKKKKKKHSFDQNKISCLFRLFLLPRWSKVHSKVNVKKHTYYSNKRTLKAV